MRCQGTGDIVDGGEAIITVQSSLVGFVQAGSGSAE